jgi:hypothetical protein
MAAGAKKQGRRNREIGYEGMANRERGGMVLSKGPVPSLIPG